MSGPEGVCEGVGGVRMSDECPRPAACEGWSRLLARAGEQGFGGSFRGAQDRGSDVTRVCARWDAGPRAGRPVAQVTLISATHCSSRRLAGGQGRQGCPGVWGDIAFLGKLWQSPRPAHAAPLARREGKSSYDSGDGYSVARGAGLFLSASRAFKKKKKKWFFVFCFFYPREAIVRNVETGRD